MIANRRVLIVDDHVETVLFVRRLLQRAGLRVFDARTKAEAMVFCDGESVDVLIADLNLPDGDGIDLFGKIAKKNPWMRESPAPG